MYNHFESLKKSIALTSSVKKKNNPFFIEAGNQEAASGFFIRIMNKPPEVLYQDYLDFLNTANQQQFDTTRNCLRFFNIKENTYDAYTGSKTLTSIKKSIKAKDAQTVMQKICSDNLAKLNKREFAEFLPFILSQQRISGRTANPLLDNYLAIWIEIAVKENLDPMKMIKNIDLDYKRAIQFNKHLLEQEKAKLEDDAKQNQNQHNALIRNKGQYQKFYLIEELLPTNHYQVPNVTKEQLQEKLNAVRGNSSILLSEADFSERKSVILSDEKQNFDIKASTKHYRFYVFTKTEKSNEYEYHSCEQKTLEAKICKIQPDHKANGYEYMAQDNLEAARTRNVIWQDGPIFRNPNNSLFKIEQEIQNIEKKEKMLADKIEELNKKITQLQSLLEGFFNYMTNDQDVVNRKLEVLNNFKEYVETIQKEFNATKDVTTVAKVNEFAESYNGRFKEVLSEHRHREWFRSIVSVVGHQAEKPDSVQLLKLEESSNMKMTMCR